MKLKSVKPETVSEETDLNELRQHYRKQALDLLCDKCLALVEAQGLTIPVRELCDNCSSKLLRWALHMDGFE